MDSHLTDDTLERLRRQELTPDELLIALRHLRGCASCTARAARHESVSRDAARVREILAAEEVRHLDEETELFAWVDGTLDAAGREIVESHLEDCAQCRATADDLRALREQRPQRGFWPAAVAAAVAIIAALAWFMSRSTTPPTRPPIANAPTYARAEWAALVEKTLDAGQLDVTRYPDLERSATVMRGPQSRDWKGEPIGIVIDDTRPRLRWTPIEAASYRVAIFDGDDEVAHSPELHQPAWRPDAGLPRGKAYTWQVAATAGGERRILPPPSLPPATFRILGAAEHGELADARRLHPDDHLLLAALYARAGMKREASDELRELAAVHPSDPRVQRLLRQATGTK